MGERKYQHYVPQTYLKKWIGENNQIHLYDKQGKIIKSGKIDRILGIKDLYTKSISYILACNDNEKKEIFECLDGYKVYCNGDLLLNENEFATNYYLFDEWIIKDNNENVRSKKVFKDKIEGKRILTIEKTLGKIEDKWNDIYESIYGIVNLNNKEELISRFNEKYMEQLKRFIFIQEWRNVNKINLYENAVEEVIGFMKEEMGEVYDEIMKEFPKCFFIKKLENFLNNISEPIIDENYNKFKMAQMKIFKATGNKKFLTNDNPILIIDNNKNIKWGLYYPISPTIILGFFKGDNTKVYIEDMPVNTIRRINKIIKTNANEFYISSEKIGE